MTEQADKMGAFARQLFDLMRNVEDEAPEGYEFDWKKALVIVDAVDRGASPLEAYDIPHNWRDRFIALSYHTELPPSLCARLSGITLSFLRLYLSKKPGSSDKAIIEALNIGRVSNFESRIDNPSARDLRSPTIPLAGLTSLASWGTDAQEDLAAGELEVKRAIEMRKQLNKEIEFDDELTAKQSEEQREENAVSFGVLGLTSVPDDFKPE
jgi:hypothetical protein